jgi:WD40 repeat protein
MSRVPFSMLLVTGLVITSVRTALSDPPAPGGDKVPGGSRSARTDRYGDSLPDGAIARLGTTRLRHTKPVGPLAFSPDGKVLASVGFSICLWDPATGKELRRIGCWARVLAFSPDGRYLAGTEDGDVRIFEVATGREVCRLRGHAYFAEGVAFSPDGKLLASGDRGKTVHLWEFPAGKEVRKLHGHGGFVVGFLPDGKSLISSCPDGYCQLDVSTGEVLRRWERTVILTTGPLMAALSPDGKLLALGGMLPRIAVYDMATGKELRGFELDEQNVMPPGQCVVFSPDGKLLAATEQTNNTVHLWEVAAGRERVRFQAGRNGGGQVAFAPDGKTLAVGAWNRVRFFDTASGKETMPFGPFVGHEDTVWELAFAPDGKTLASLGERDDWVPLWDPLTGKELRKLGLSEAGPVAFSADGKAVASAGKGGAVRVWGLATGKILRDWAKKEQDIRALTFSPEGHLLALGEQENSVTVWDVTAERARWQRRVEYGAVQRPQFSADGKALLFAGSHGPVNIWEADTGRELRRVATRAREHFISPSGSTLAAIGTVTESPDGQSRSLSYEGLTLWSLAGGQEPHPFRLDSRDYLCAAFSPDGRVVAAGSGEYRMANQVRLYELASGREIGVFRGHRHGITCLAFSADGRMLASGSHDQTALVWDLTGLLEGGSWRARPLAPEELEKLWSDLGGPDAARAYRAMWRLAAAPPQRLVFSERSCGRRQRRMRRASPAWLPPSTPISSRCARRQRPNWNSSASWRHRICERLRPGSRRRSCAAGRSRSSPGCRGGACRRGSCRRCERWRRWNTLAVRTPARCLNNSRAGHRRPGSPRKPVPPCGGWPAVFLRPCPEAQAEALAVRTRLAQGTRRRCHGGRFRVDLSL